LWGVLAERAAAVGPGLSGMKVSRRLPQRVVAAYGGLQVHPRAPRPLEAAGHAPVARDSVVLAAFHHDQAPPGQNLVALGLPRLAGAHHRRRAQRGLLGARRPRCHVHDRGAHPCRRAQS